jgi:hypothetical protein
MDTNTGIPYPEQDPKSDFGYLSDFDPHELDLEELGLTSSSLEPSAATPQPAPCTLQESSQPLPQPDWSAKSRLPPFISRLPAHITLLDVAAKFGLDCQSFDGAYYRCPFHNDNRRPNLKLNKPDSRDGWFYCFSCCASGDLIHWVARRFGVHTLHAYLKIRESYSLGPDELLRLSTPQPVKGPVRLYAARKPTTSELESLAYVGQWDLSALQIHACREILRVVPKYKGFKAYALCDPYYRIVVLRRLDGQLWDANPNIA